jgi:hypothetical protein
MAQGEYDPNSAKGSKLYLLVNCQSCPVEALMYIDQCSNQLFSEVVNSFHTN